MVIILETLEFVFGSRNMKKAAILDPNAQINYSSRHLKTVTI